MKRKGKGEQGKERTAKCQDLLITSTTNKAHIKQPGANKVKCNEEKLKRTEIGEQNTRSLKGPNCLFSPKKTAERNIMILNVMR